MADDQAPLSEENVSQTNKRGPWSLIAIVVIATVISIMLVPGENESTDASPPIPPPDQAPSLLPAPQPPTTEVIPDSQQPAAEPQAPGGPGAEARALVARLRANPPPDLAHAFEAAQQYQAEGRLEDAYLLLFFAAREGHGPAALNLAKKFDPATFEPGGLFEQPDELQSYKWYRAAIEAGISEAKQPMKKLQQQVEQAAESGDSRARRISLQWN